MAFLTSPDGTDLLGADGAQLTDGVETTTLLDEAVAPPPTFNFSETILSQYANSPVLLRLIDNINTCINPSANIDSFYNLVWNLPTAQGYGLDVWGRIVGVNRVLQVTTSGYFSFKESGNPNGQFGQAPFYAGQPVTSNYALTDDAFRILIYAKAAANICNGSILAINQILMTLNTQLAALGFSTPGDCYVTDNGGMAMTYTFRVGTLTPLMSAIVNQGGVLPKPSGVSASIVVI